MRDDCEAACSRFLRKRARRQRAGARRVQLHAGAAPRTTASACRAAGTGARCSTATRAIYGGSGMGNLGGVEAAARAVRTAADHSLHADAAAARRARSSARGADMKPRAERRRAQRADGRARVVIERVHAAGRRRPLPGQARASATRSWSRPTCFADGHDVVACALLYAPRATTRLAARRRWSRSATTAGAASFRVETLGRYRYTVRGWVDRFLTWRARPRKRRVDAGQDLAHRPRRSARAADRCGAERDCDGTATRRDRARRRAARLDARDGESRDRRPRFDARTRSQSLRRPRARALPHLVRALPALGCGEPGAHGTFATARRAALRRGAWASTCSTCRRSTRSAPPSARARTTRVAAQPGDVGSPWAIGATEGGHKAIHPELGTLDDFRAPGRRARTSTASRSRSTSRSSARPTIRT